MADIGEIYSRLVRCRASDLTSVIAGVDPNSLPYAKILLGPQGGPATNFSDTYIDVPPAIIDGNGNFVPTQWAYVIQTTRYGNINVRQTRSTLVAMVMKR